MSQPHRVLLDAADGRFPDVDGAVEILEPMAGDHHATVEFTGHSFVLTDQDPAGSLSELRFRSDRRPDAPPSTLMKWQCCCTVATRNWNTFDVCGAADPR
jgi:hypothetical protein